jgi:hypothetical protein
MPYRGHDGETPAPTARSKPARRAHRRSRYAIRGSKLQSQFDRHPAPQIGAVVREAELRPVPLMRAKFPVFTAEPEILRNYAADIPNLKPRGIAAARRSPSRLTVLLKCALSPPVRNASTPMPATPAILPPGPVVSVSTAVTHQLDPRVGSEFGRASLRRGERGGLYRSSRRQGYPAGQYHDDDAHFNLRYSGANGTNV